MVSNSHLPRCFFRVSACISCHWLCPFPGKAVLSCIFRECTGIHVLSQVLSVGTTPRATRPDVLYVVCLGDSIRDADTCLPRYLGTYLGSSLRSIAGKLAFSSEVPGEVPREVSGCLTTLLQALVHGGLSLEQEADAEQYIRRLAGPAWVSVLLVGQIQHLHVVQCCSISGACPCLLTRGWWADKGRQAYLLARKVTWWYGLDGRQG